MVSLERWHSACWLITKKRAVSREACYGQTTRQQDHRETASDVTQQRTVQCGESYIAISSNCPKKQRVIIWLVLVRNAIACYVFCCYLVFDLSGNDGCC